MLSWENAMRGAPAKYLSKAEDALFEFEHGEPPPARVLPWWGDEESEETEEDAPEDLEGE